MPDTSGISSGTQNPYATLNGKEWHFTNKAETQENNKDDFILITKDAKIRLVHTVKESTVRNGVKFFDYDVSDGNLYTKYSTTPKPTTNVESWLTTVDRGKARTHNGEDDPVWYMYTRKQGINNNGANQNFGFGNSNGSMRTMMLQTDGADKGKEYPWNMANRDGDNEEFGKAYFGLVTGMENGDPKFRSDVIAPNLFNENAAQGKTPYVGDLIFSQKGDTYTLTGAEVKEKGVVTSSIDGIDKFKDQKFSYNSTYWFAANNFYPLDGLPAYCYVRACF